MRANRWIVVVLLLLTSLAGSHRVSAQDATPASLAGVQPQPLTADELTSFETYIADMLEQSHVPGASVAVVQNGEVVYLHGFGVRELGQDAPVTPDTLMMIGSVTKSMTSMMAGSLIDDGALTWDTPVVSLLPDFALSDPERTKTLSIRDSYCMCTGVPARDADFVFNSSELTPQKLIASVADFPLTAPLGQTYQYSNQMYAIGGYAATVAAGGSIGSLYDDYVTAMRDRLLAPIGMSTSTFSLKDVEASGDYSGSHAPDLSGAYRPVSLADEDDFVTSVAPAGALWSNARDMASYMQTQLAGGVAPDGTRVVSTENLEATWEPRIAMEMPADPSIPPELAEMAESYDMGWVTGSYRGQRMLNHSGGTLGFTSEMAFLPDADVGIVLLTNGVNADVFNYAVQFRLFELVFGQEQTFGALATAFLQGAAQQTAAFQQQLGMVDPASVTPFLGSYANEDLGEVTLSLQDGELILDAGEVRSGLRPYNDESGAMFAYLLADPPWAGSGTIVFGQDSSPTVMTLTELQSGTEYPFEASSAPATPPT